MSLIKTVLILVLLFCFQPQPSFATQDEFCSGFKRGYITGYREASGSSLKPLVPICPLQPLKGYGDPDSDFEHGYTIGYKQGLSDG